MMRSEFCMTKPKALERLLPQSLPGNSKVLKFQSTKSQDETASNISSIHVRCPCSRNVQNESGGFKLGNGEKNSSIRSGFTASIRSWKSSSDSEEENINRAVVQQEEESHKHSNMVTILSPTTNVSLSGSDSSGGHKRFTDAVQEENIEVRIAEEKMPMLRVKNRSQNLPRTSYYSSNHIMVNNERTRRNIPALIRNSDLDAVARSHAENMAKAMKLYHSNPRTLQEEIGQSNHCLFFGANISMGPTIRVIHRRMIESMSDLTNMLDSRFTEMGMATATGQDGNLFLCQIFRG